MKEFVGNKTTTYFNRRNNNFSCKILITIFSISSVLLFSVNHNNLVFGQNSVTNPRKTPLRRPHEQMQNLESLYNDQGEGESVSEIRQPDTDAITETTEASTNDASCALWVQVQHAYTPNVVHSQDLAFQVVFTNGATDYRRTGARTYIPGLISSFNIGRTICNAAPIGVSIEDINDHTHLGEHSDQCRILDVKLRYQGAYYLYNGPIKNVDDDPVYFPLDGPSYI